MSWEKIIKDTEGKRALDVLYDAYEKLEKSKDEVLKMISKEDKAEAKKEFDAGFKAIGSMLNYFKNYIPDSELDRLERY
tara:strand:+ start:5351 stop:5587 length:237 start_codon:yes stop_codon:yes gene_type:complete